MGKVVRFLKEQSHEHEKELTKTPESRHAETLLFKQLEYKDRFLREHFVENDAQHEALVLVERLRKLTPKLEAKPVEAEE